MPWVVVVWRRNGRNLLWAVYGPMPTEQAAEEFAESYNARRDPGERTSVERLIDPGVSYEAA